MAAKDAASITARSASNANANLEATRNEDSKDIFSAIFLLANDNDDDNNKVLKTLNSTLNSDPEFLAATSGLDRDLCFALACSASSHLLQPSTRSSESKAESTSSRLVFKTATSGITTVTMSAGREEARTETNKEAQGVQFTLLAQPEHWRNFFATSGSAPPPFQSYWGMLRVLGRDAGVEVVGDVSAFGASSLAWRLALDRAKGAVARRSSPDSSVVRESSREREEGEEEDDNAITGHYTTLTLPHVGKSKIFYEVCGHGAQDVLFLHTAGADGRQFHGLMTADASLRETCTMYVFDLPGHGRSFPGETQWALGYANDEDFYVTAIAAVIARLRLKRVVVCGASMGGQVCLGVALRAREMNMDVRGVIPCEACDYLPAQHAQGIYALAGDEAILNPERVCGMIAPTAPDVLKRLNWWIYSSQAARIFPGDLKFYFEGWDARDRVATIDTRRCSVYMLTGEYDYSCSPDRSRATASKINGAVFEEMAGLGHFPMSEDPKRFLPYFNRALEHIWRQQT